jgi:hypothetical protein
MSESKQQTFPLPDATWRLLTLNTDDVKQVLDDLMLDADDLDPKGLPFVRNVLLRLVAWHDASPFNREDVMTDAMRKKILRIRDAACELFEAYEFPVPVSLTERHEKPYRNAFFQKEMVGGHPALVMYNSDWEDLDDVRFGFHGMEGIKPGILELMQNCDAVLEEAKSLSSPRGGRPSTCKRDEAIRDLARALHRVDLASDETVSRLSRAEFATDLRKVLERLLRLVGLEAPALSAIERVIKERAPELKFTLHPEKNP